MYIGHIYIFHGLAPLTSAVIDSFFHWPLDWDIFVQLIPATF